MMKVSNNKNLFKSYWFFLHFIQLTRRKTRKTNISNAKVREYIWKIFAQKTMKTLNIIFYDIHYQFNCSGYNFTMIATI